MGSTIARRLGLSAVALVAWTGIGSAQEVARPNFLVIVADDLGYSDIGTFGSEIRTPNLDHLAAQGTVLTEFYAAPFCSPTRAMLMTGADNHQVGFGAMTELVPPELRQQAGYEGYLNERAVAFPQLLQDAGYRTYMTGKWHLGTAENVSPASRGFDRSYALVQGGAGHFDQTGTIAADPEKTPKALYRQDGVEVDLPKDFYSSTFFVDQMIGYLDQDRGSAEPFFAYLAFTAPHWPLQAPAEDIARYEGVYDAGYDAIRDSRLAAMRERGIVGPDADLFRGSEAWPTWAELTPYQQRVESKRMAVYAAMVDRMDQEIGRLLDYLGRTGQLDNTFILFMSDNGADGNTPSDVAQTREWIARHFDNSVENTGTATSYVDYGPGWAQVGSTPLRLYKAFQYEGGIRVPAFVVLPENMRGATGAISSAFTHTTDVAPTVLDLAGVPVPGDTYRGQPAVPMIGASLRPLLTGEAAFVHEPDHVTGWELQGRKALRKGDWKIVFANKPWGTEAWELYDLASDPSELENLAASNPGKLQELIADYEAWTERTGTLDLTTLGEEVGYSNGMSYYEDMCSSAPEGSQDGC